MMVVVVPLLLSLIFSLLSNSDCKCISIDNDDHNCDRNDNSCNDNDDSDDNDSDGDDNDGDTR